jgi:hypothetical protein
MYRKLREAGQPFRQPSFRTGHAGDDSIDSGALAEDVIR